MSNWIGGYIPRGRQESAFSRIVAGALLISLMAALPWIGPVVLALVIFVGVGALVLDCYDTWRCARLGDKANGTMAMAGPSNRAESR